VRRERRRACTERSGRDPAERWISLGPYEPVHGLVAECAGELVGLTHYIFHRSTTMIGPTCHLQDLFTREVARGKGVGRMLVAGVCERAGHAGAGRVYWHTHETNATARRLYDDVALRSGFIVYRKDLA